jgi:Zn-dependent membrane protease YugP
MYIVLIVLAVSALIFGPQFWAKQTFKRYHRYDPAIEGNGGQLARHLLDRYGLSSIKVEITPLGDHYDPQSKTVRLTHDYYHGKSLTAIAVAAHEVGHAIQHHRGEKLLDTRTKLVKAAQWSERLGSVIMFGIPIVTAITRAPSAAALTFLAGLATMFLSTVVHLVTLPVELDASFNKALPLLREGGYIQPKDENAVRKILRAAALTYVASSLASLLNLARWIAVLRRR